LAGSSRLSNTDGRNELSSLNSRHRENEIAASFWKALKKEQIFFGKKDPVKKYTYKASKKEEEKASRHYMII